MTLMAAAALSVLSLVLIESKKTAANISTRAQADRDVARALELIEATIIAPNSCNANFYTPTLLPKSGSLSGPIKKCTSGTGTCRLTGSSSSILQFNTWSMFVGDPKPAKAQLTSATYAITTAQTASKPATLTLTVTLSKKIGVSNGVIRTSSQSYTLSALVVTNATKILGCAKNNASISPY